MRQFLWIMVILIVAAILGVFIARFPGFLLLQLGQGSYAAPLWMVFLGTVFSLIILYIIYKTLSFLLFIPQSLRHYQQTNRQKKQLRLLGEGLEQFVIQDFKTASNAFSQLAKLNFLQAQSLLMALVGAQATGDKKAQIVIKKQLTQQSASLAPHTLLLVEVDALLDEGAKASLMQAKEHLLALKATGTQAILIRLFEVYLELQEYTQAFNIFLQLDKKEQPLDGQIRMDLLVGFLHESSSTHETLENAWKKIPTKDKQEVLIVSTYLNGLISLKQTALAEKLLRKQLNYAFDDELFDLFSTLSVDNDKKQLALAEGWLKNQELSTQISLAMGRICAKNKLFGRAKHYFEQSLALGPTLEATKSLAKLLEDNGQLDEALAIYGKWL